MEEKKIFKVTSNPIVRTPRDTSKIMLDVIIALVPALGVGAYMFGMNVAILLVVNVAACVVFEWAYRKLMKKNTSVGDLSAVVTGVLITCVMPSAAPWWVGLIGSFFAIIVVKQLYGGIGKNFLNPALAARAFMSAAYAAYMTTWAQHPAQRRGRHHDGHPALLPEQRRGPARVLQLSEHVPRRHPRQHR